MDDIFTRIFYSVPEDRTPTSFLPRLQFIEFKLNNASAPFSWGYIPKFYRDGHRRSLTLRTFVHKSDITDQTAVQLVNEGVNLQIIDEETGGDFLENFRNRMHEQGVEFFCYFGIPRI